MKAAGRTQSWVGIVLPSLPLFPVQREPGSLAHLISPACWYILGAAHGYAGGLKVLQGIISGQVQWSPSCLSWLFRIKGERDADPGSFIFFLQALIISLHSSLQFGASGWLCAPRWLRGGALSSRAGAGRLWPSGKSEMVPGALALGKQREFYLTVDASRTSLWVLPALLSFCSLPNDFNSWTLLPFALSSSQLQGGRFGVEFKCGRMNVCSMNGFLSADIRACAPGKLQEIIG